MTVIAVGFSLIGPHSSSRLTAMLALGLFTVLVWNAYFGIPPASEYGEEKLLRLYTSTLLSALAASLVSNQLRLLSLGKFWISLTTALALLTIIGDSTFSQGRATLFDNNPIWLARALASGALFSLGLFKIESRRLWLLPVAPLVVALLLTGSRGPAAGFAVGLLLLYVRSGPRLIGALAASVATYLAFLFVPFLAATRIGAFLNGTGDSDYGLSNRTEMWSLAFQTWVENPSGVGVGNWKQIGSSIGHEWPHNIWLEIAAELGTIPAISLIGLVAWTALYVARRHSGSTIGRLILALLATECVAVSMSGDISARTFFFLLFLAVHSTLWPHTSKNASSATASNFSNVAPKDNDLLRVEDRRAPGS